MNYIPYARQWIDREDIEAVIAALESDWIVQGPQIEQFEEKLADYVGAKYAVAVSSGTAALHVACLAANIGPDDEVITTPITFVATANCVLYCGGKPVFVDIDPRTYNIDPERIENYLELKTKNRKLTTTKAIIPLHFAGQPCDMERIWEIAKKYDLIVVEDACHALGAEYKSRNRWLRVGGCAHSDMACFSFHPIKSITTGWGGAVTTNNGDYYERLLMFRTHGITKDPNRFINKDLAYNQSLMTNNNNQLPNPWYYEMQELGYNYQVSDFQCALGMSQLKRLDAFLARRREIAERYNEAFKDADSLVVPAIDSQQPATNSAWHLYTARVRRSRTQVFNTLREKGIGVQVHYIPVYYHPYYQKLGYRKGLCAEAERFYEEAISLPLFPKMSDKDTEYTIKMISNTFASLHQK